MLNCFSHILVIWVFHRFSLVLVDEKLLHFSQLLVELQLPTFILYIYILYIVVCILLLCFMFLLGHSSQMAS